MMKCGVVLRNVLYIVTIFHSYFISVSVLFILVTFCLISIYCVKLSHLTVRDVSCIPMKSCTFMVHSRAGALKLRIHFERMLLSVPSGGCSFLLRHCHFVKMGKYVTKLILHYPLVPCTGIVQFQISLPYLNLYQLSSICPCTFCFLLFMMNFFILQFSVTILMRHGLVLNIICS